MTALGVELPDGSVIFGQPRPTGDAWYFGDVEPAWLGGLTADEYERLVRR